MITIVTGNDKRTLRYIVTYTIAILGLCLLLVLLIRALPPEERRLLFMILLFK